MQRPDLVALAHEIALEVHADHVDRSGEPYIDHPRRVARRLQDPVLQAAALLHDVVEDSEVTLDDLRSRGVPDEVLEVVDLVTKRPADTDYGAAVRRAASDPRSWRVKRADVDDNSELWRMAALDDDLRERLRAKYELAGRILEEAAADHPELTFGS